MQSNKYAADVVFARKVIISLFVTSCKLQAIPVALLAVELHLSFQSLLC